MTDEFDPLAALHEHLAATEERPVEREAGWRLGEAQALAAEIAGGGVDEEVAVRRAGEIRTLLAEVDRTGDAEADDHVAAARELANRIATRADGG
ncbi:hypothetical protein C463_01671 [Halorubrum californiense DSM 19288]|uniref:DUF8152 domain-containing protein n=1 Tax=Halorubrum californiense DSM 19288 TaxID=1227465 RepID=M0EKE5_9EURY|nr:MULTISPECIES: hypothetical protein [Halorubrum]ELZ48256.1 hypothetical protein C463_01671 [Halorubrum californiense DSM 19288]TKX68356.1 hypothetical protein EXE40_12910 [Halorubrum sp. GN11GM_10-3_MGM]